MSTESKLHDKLQGLAESGPAPDETAAWDAISSRMQTDVARRRRNRWMLGGSGVLVASAAAAAIFVLAGADSETSQPVDIGPRVTGPSTVPTTEASVPRVTKPTTNTTGTTQPAAPTGDLPANPVAVTADEWHTLHVVDGDTGTLVSTPIPNIGSDQAIHDPVMTPDGTIYFNLTLPEGTTVVRTRWDATGGYDRLNLPEVSTESSGYSFPAISPDGKTLAVSRTLNSADFSTVEYSIGLFDLATSQYRELKWPDGDSRGTSQQPQGLSFSPDGRRLAFTNVHDTDGTEGFEGYVVGVDAGSLADAQRIDGELWDMTFTPEGDLLVIEGDTRSEAVFRYAEGGADHPIPPLDNVNDLFTSRTRLYAHTGEGTFRYDDVSDSWVDAGFQPFTI